MVKILMYCTALYPHDVCNFTSVESSIEFCCAVSKLSRFFSRSVPIEIDLLEIKMN